jgi:hypothetical protein
MCTFIICLAMLNMTAGDSIKIGFSRFSRQIDTIVNPFECPAVIQYCSVVYIQNAATIYLTDLCRFSLCRIILPFLVSYPTLFRFMPVRYEVERLQKLLY